ncbi:MAG: hypothetical protein KGM42_02900 [Hyphomicrobiales bacterium]|nr:hypothetical protein [Hyphomicrobiales bacterium]
MVNASSAVRAASLALATFLFAGGFAQSVAQTPAASTHQAQIDRNGLLILIKSTLIGLDQANKTGNYSVLRDLAAPSFAMANNAARLAEIFANLRRDKIDLSGVLVLEPQLSVLPEITPQGMLHFAGFFPSAPTQINFEMLFAPIEGQWRLFGVSTNLGSSTPAPPQPPTPQAAASTPARPAAHAATKKSAPEKR